MNARKSLVLALAAGLIWFSTIPPLGAQSSAGLKGTIVDKEGNPLPAATVSVKNPTLGVSQGAVTDTKGEFRIVPLPPGKGYTLEVSFPGMGKITMDVEITAGRLSTVPVTLRPDTEMQTRIKVTAQTEVVNTAETQISTKFSSEFIDALPILGRNYQDVLTLAPGVSDTDGDGNPNIHGSRETDVVTLVDGVSTTDPFTGQRGLELNLDSIQEIEVKTSGASAEFGRAQGGFVNIVTKSGGNEFEGQFSFNWRSNLLDGDGAGIDNPRLHGGLGEIGLRDLDFADYEPFVSVSGPIVKDKAWYYVTFEYRQIENPVNATTQAFVRPETQKRIFGKATWEVSTNHKLQFTANLDPQSYENLGIDSFTALEAGYTDDLGGLNLTLKETSVFSPNVFLETTVQHFTTEPARFPTINPDTNGNGLLFREYVLDGFIDAKEGDPGVDFDGDGAYDVFEDGNRNGSLDLGAECALNPDGGPCGEDRDGDRRLTAAGVGCESALREDQDCDGRIDTINEDIDGDGVLDVGEDADADRRLDNINEDWNGNGILEPAEDRNGNGLWDGQGSYVEDRNNNGLLDDRAFPRSDDEYFRIQPDGTRVPLPASYPYDNLAPLPPDRPYTTDFRTLRTFGPYNNTFERDLRRITLRQDLTAFVPEWHGQHDLKFGGVIEKEDFSQVDRWRAYKLDNAGPPTLQSIQPRVGVILPTALAVPNEANNTTLGFYVNDTYKPMSNLTINLGVRFDREMTDSFGYTQSDPVAQRALYDRLWGLAGEEVKGGDDKLVGNNDGVLSSGYCADPLFIHSGGGTGCSNPGAGTESTAAYEQQLSRLRLIAPSRLMQHHISTTVTAQNLELLFPEAFKTDPITGEKSIDREVLRAQGAATFQEREAFRLSNNNLSPRVSISWDPFADSKTKVFANWSRFYDKLFLSAVVPEEGPDFIYRYYQKDADQITGSGLPNGGYGNVVSKAPPNSSQIDRGLQTPFSDEFSIGFEREIAPEVSFKMTFVSIKRREQLQDVDINHSVRFDDATGEPLDNLGAFEPVGGNSPIGRRVADGRPDLYIHNFFFNRIFRYGNVNEAYYKGVELQLTKRLSRKWQMDGSYTYSRAIGNAESFNSALGDDPATRDAEYGYLDLDQRHVVKLNAVTYLPRDWQVGSTITWSSGLPYSVISFFPASDNYDYLQQRFLYGFTSRGTVKPIFNTVPRNTLRNDSFYNIDVRGEKAFVLGKLSSKLYITVENLLNDDVLDIRTFEPAAPNRGGSLQLNAEREFGRRFQVGFSFEF